MINKPIVIGITGGSGSGKSTVVKSVTETIPQDKMTIIPQDAYYKDQSHLSTQDRLKTNYDHPLAFDNDLLIKHVNQLFEGKSIKRPIYDFSKHNRDQENYILIEPKEIIILEGIMILEDERLRKLMDIKIFVDTDADLRILRRIQRDIEERGRSLESVISQYLDTVRPAHMQFIEPSKKYADIIIPEGGHNTVAIDMLITKIQSIIQRF